MLSLVGGLAGVLLGIVASKALGALAGWSMELSSGAIALAFGFAAGVGVFFGFYPARRGAGP